jgi:hypothetical protein
MIAIALGLFLIGGLLTLVQAMRRTSTNQSGLSQLQDNERMAMQLITDVVQSTGTSRTRSSTRPPAQFPAATYGPAVFTYRTGSRRQRRRPRHHHHALPDGGDECRRQRHQLHRKLEQLARELREPDHRREQLPDLHALAQRSRSPPWRSFRASPT